ncbi:MAG TPA: transporter substrate-binding domain-containing protein, partial [Anaerolineales bacterium]|nr:transporter substrate-binding domain-containing protein [Anaerolineales bacterium]
MTEQTTNTNVIDALNDQKIGLLSRIWQGRKWYGAEWYITGFGGLILFVILILAAFAPQISPYDPNGFVGAPFTPPGQGTQTLLTRSGENLAVDPEDLEWVELNIGVQRNKNGKKVADANEAASTRFMTEDEMLEGLETGAVDYIFVDDNMVSEILAAYPGFEIVATGLGTSFPLGTDNLGRDYVSRIIWGARTIMSVALASALLSSVTGITLGLIAGFVSGALDRILSLVMDSIYSFPGLLLAIAMVA